MKKGRQEGFSTLEAFCILTLLLSAPDEATTGFQIRSHGNTGNLRDEKQEDACCLSQEKKETLQERARGQEWKGAAHLPFTTDLNDIEDDMESAELCKSTPVAHIWSVPMEPGNFQRLVQLSFEVPAICNLAQQYVVNEVCHPKTRSNHEYKVGLITLANDGEVLITLTPDTGSIWSMLHTIQPKCKITFCTIIRIAHLTLKHQQGKNHKLCIIAFVGSPVEDNEKDLIKLGKHLKKEKVNVDIINFGEEEVNTENVTAFVNTLNGKDGTCSRLVTMPPGPNLVDALISSPTLAGEGGAMLGLGASYFEFEVDPSADPELALALRGTEDSDDALLNMTISQQEFGCTGLPDLSSKIEKEQIAYAIQMSLQGAEFGQAESANLDANSVMGKSEPTKEEDDYDMMQDPEFFQSVLENLLGMDTDNEVIQNAIGSLDSQATKDGKKDKKKEDKK
ncbi:26S proteasome non-ATPase regulatory subunit 4 [Sciurus carolinensis]|uniref:26S proteasome non-ATPase regulatory subunit 4 n=1 Tax=Sciurus carolinensis TaxID=30640 RepID=A0AA41MHU9_SCICA|nr:26S proteasome non-ATPase regulatory subunit 4 [Sciurus carolinensis]